MIKFFLFFAELGIIFSLLFIIISRIGVLLSRKKMKKLEEIYDSYLDDFIQNKGNYNENLQVVKKLLLNDRNRFFFVRRLTLFSSKYSFYYLTTHFLRHLVMQLDIADPAIKDILSGKSQKILAGLDIFLLFADQRNLFLISELTTHRNKMVRIKSRILFVKISGFKGLIFLNTISEFLSIWEQILIVNCLKFHYNDQKKFKINKEWLFSRNFTVVITVTMIISEFWRLDYADLLFHSLKKHHHALVRKHIVSTLNKFEYLSAKSYLKSVFFEEDIRVQEQIILFFEHHCNDKDLPFIDEMIKSANNPYVNRFENIKLSIV